MKCTLKVFLSFLLLVTTVYSYAQLEKATALALVERTVPKHAAQFVVEEIKADPGKDISTVPG